MVELVTGPLISCIVPSFNSGSYLREALDSIMEQSYRPIEVIVADDGSHDNVEDIVTNYGKGVKFFRQDTAGPAATRNLGLSRCTGGLVAFLDADDLWRPDKLAKQAAYFAADPDLDVCVSFVQVFWDKDRQVEKDMYGDHPRLRPVPGYATTTLLARRSAFEKVGNFNEDYWFSDATDWFVRAREQRLNIYMLPEVLTFHRMHGNNLTKRRVEESRDEFLNLVKRALDRRRGR